MNRFLRIVVVWIVAMALPIQGFAAAAMISCEPMHEQKASAAHSHQGGEHHGNDHGAAPGHSHEDPGTSSGLLEFLKITCSACASCCAGVAAPFPALPSLDVVQPHSLPIAFFGSSTAGVVPAVLERPPSDILA